MERAKKGLQRMTSILLIVAAAYGGACTAWGLNCGPNTGNSFLNCDPGNGCCSGPDPYTCNFCEDDEGCDVFGYCINPL